MNERVNFHSHLKCDVSLTDSPAILLTLKKGGENESELVNDIRIKFIKSKDLNFLDFV